MMAAHASFPTIFNALNYFNNRPAATPNNLDDSDDDDTDDSGGIYFRAGMVIYRAIFIYIIYYIYKYEPKR